MVQSQQPNQLTTNDTPIQADAIKAPGEPAQLKAPRRVKYICACRMEPRHFKIVFYDEQPPNYCPRNAVMHRDSTWIDEE